MITKNRNLAALNNSSSIRNRIGLHYCNDWIAQIEKPNQRLLAITGKPVTYFAYPFGVWNDTAVTEIKKYPFKAAFQLTAKRSEMDPLYTIRRTLVPGSWPTSKLLKRMQTMF
jgi:peptidoglycan/xylan/chitin deacetylase (PgdA/CDA1 family)